MKTWTESQKTAIEYTGRNLLLSAAAGSGKTTVLVERVLHLIDEGADIMRMLIVTFTRAAALELKTRLAAALENRIALEPRNAHLRRSLVSLEVADICTIDSFCLKIVRRYFQALSLAPDFRIAEEAATEKLREEIMRDVVSEYLNSVRTTPLASLALSRSDSALDEALIALAKKLSERGMSADELCSLVAYGGEKYLDSAYGAVVRGALSRFAEHYERMFAYYADALAADGDDKAYIICADDCLSRAKSLKDKAQTASYDELRHFFSRSGTLELSRKKKITNDIRLVEEFKANRTDFNNKFKALGAAYFSLNEEECDEAMRRNADVFTAAAAVCGEFFRRFEKAKRDRAVVDFGDLERYCARILINPDGSPGRAAGEISSDYDYIFVDEYQDTNHLQDMIFSALAGNTCRRFLVGDVKQSIYSFRAAEPEVFVKYREIWNGQADRAVFMSENFRCDKSVIGFSNAVSEYMFAGTGTPFEEGDRLIFAKNEADDKGIPAEVCIVEKPKKADKDKAENDDDGVMSGDEAEAEYVAGRIEELLSEGVRCCDIAILLRSPNKGLGQLYADTLSRHRIPNSSDAFTDLFGEAEIELVMCLLHAVDNPLRDIYLAGAMKSPVFAFTLDDLALIRAACPAPSLWASMKAMSAADGELSDKCSKAVQRLGEMREYSRSFGADRFILYLYRETRLTSLGDRGKYNNAVIRKNLTRLYDMARRSEASGYRGLYGFLSFIDDAADRISDSAGDSSLAAMRGKNGDSVSILSVHKAKGLEFPVVFLCSAAKKLNQNELSDNLLFDREAGPATRLLDDGGLVMCDTPVRQTVAEKMRIRAVEEEMRILYVAMTRAKNRLIITCCHDNPERLLSKAAAAAGFASPYTALGAHCFTDWLIPAALAYGKAKITIAAAHGTQDENDKELCDANIGENETANENTVTPEQIKEARDILSQRFSFVYPKEYLTRLPSKLTVSKLYPGILDSGETASLDLRKERFSQDAETVPSGFSGDGVPGAYELALRKPSAADAGTATHLFMQFCDFGRLAASGAKSEQERLVGEGFITEKLSSLIRFDEIEMFLKSGLFARICSAKRLMREFRFSTIMDASRFTDDAALRRQLCEDNVKITVQGVVDCMFIDENDSLVLVDYKTDRLTAEEKRSPEKAAAKLLSRHKSQLEYYACACRAMMGRPVDELYLYSLALGDTVSL